MKPPRLLPVLCAVSFLSSCRPASKPPEAEDPYLLRMDFLEKKISELRDTLDRRLQDERVRRENQLAVLDRSVRDFEGRVASLSAKLDELTARLSELERKASQSSGAAQLVAPSVNNSVPVAASVSAAPRPPEIEFPIHVTDITAAAIPVRTQASVRVLETGRMVRDEKGQRIPEIRSETYPVYEYEYRVRFCASNRAESAVSFVADGGYEVREFTLKPRDKLEGIELRWRPGASLLVRAEGRTRMFAVPPPPPSETP